LSKVDFMMRLLRYNFYVKNRDVVEIAVLSLFQKIYLTPDL